MLRIRPATDFDLRAIEDTYHNAFGPGQGQEIVQLVNGLLDDQTAQPRLSLVAEGENAIVAHILFTRAWLHHVQREVSIRILAPLAVGQAFQGQRIGGALIMEGLRRLDATGVELVFVLGYPGYYAKFGFRPAGALGFAAPYPIPAQHAEAWMVQALRSGVIGNIQGTIECAKALDDPRHWRE